MLKNIVDLSKIFFLSWVKVILDCVVTATCYPLANICPMISNLMMHLKNNLFLTSIYRLVLYTRIQMVIPPTIYKIKYFLTFLCTIYQIYHICWTAFADNMTLKSNFSSQIYSQEKLLLSPKIVLIFVKFNDLLL